ncbi:hypothetical protein ACA910_008232 [Epithemia clementina (nom. ined.)]
MSEPPIDMSSTSPFLEEEQHEITNNQVFTHVIEKVLQIKPAHVTSIQGWMYYHGMDTFRDIIDMISWTPDDQIHDLQGYKIGNTMHDLPLVVLTKLKLITKWALEQIASMKIILPNSIWLALDKDTYNQWHIAYNQWRFLSVSQGITVTPTHKFMYSLSDEPKISGSITSMFLNPSVVEHDHSVPNTNNQSEGTSVVPDYQSEPYQQHHNIAGNSYRTIKHESAEDMHQVIPHANDEHVDITSSDLHLDPSAEETHSTLSPDHNTICNYSAEEPSHMMHTISDDNPPEDYELSHTFVHIFAENGEKFNACTIKIIEDTDKETKGSIIVIDDPDQVTMKGPVDIDYPDEDLPKTNVNIAHPDLAIVTFDDHLPDQSNSKKHNKENTIMTNPTLLSPLQGNCYNMAQQQLHHVATLTNQRETHHGSLKTSSISSDAHLGKTSSAPSYDVTAHCNQDSLPDFPTYHTKVQTSLRSEYFDAFSQLMHLIAQKKPVYKKMTCLHGETKHDHHSICVEMLHEKNAPNPAFENSTPNHLMHHSPSLHPPDLGVSFHNFAISKLPLLFVSCKVTLDNHLGNYVHFHHTQEFSPTNLADDDPASIHPKSIFFHSPADDDPTQSLLSTWPLIPYLLDASITFCPTL